LAPVLIVMPDKQLSQVLRFAGYLLHDFSRDRSSPHCRCWCQELVLDAV